jgi:hypothetical protein
MGHSLGVCHGTPLGVRHRRANVIVNVTVHSGALLEQSIAWSIRPHASPTDIGRFRAVCAIFCRGPLAALKLRLDPLVRPPMLEECLEHRSVGQGESFFTVRSAS